MMNYSLFDGPVRTRDGEFLDHSQYGAPSIAGDTTNLADSGMEEMFDFPRYHSECQADAWAGDPGQESTTYYQQHDDPQSDEFMDDGQPEDVDDDDGIGSPVQLAAMSYYSGDPLDSHLIPLLSSSFEEDLVDPPGSVRIADLIDLPKSEKWDVDKATMEFLASILTFSAPAKSPSTRFGTGKYFRNVKVEEPVLQSDAATDMLRLHERNTIRVTPKGIKPIPLDKCHDQDLRWSTKSLRLPHDIDELLAAEKMAVDVKTGRFLKNLVEGLKGDLITSLLNERHHKPPLRLITPPLLPVSPQYSPGRIPSSAANIPFTSTPEDPLVREAAELETQIMMSDLDERMGSIGSEANLTHGWPNTPTKSSSSPLRRKASKISDLKLSSPLLPIEPSVPPTKKPKTVSFAEELSALVPQRDCDDVSTDPFDAADEALAAISAMVEPFSRAAMAQNEQLIEMDTIARVTVPAIEAVEPEMPWMSYSGRQRTILQEFRADFTKTERKWGGTTSLDRLLPWSPFPAHLGKPKPEGDFDDGSLLRYLGELDIEVPAKVQSMVWKMDGLRILDDEEEELNVYQHEPDEGVTGQESLPRERQVASKAPQESAKSLYFGSPPPPRNRHNETSATLAAATCSIIPEASGQRKAEPEVNSMQVLLEKRRMQLQREKAALNANILQAANASPNMILDASVNTGTLSAFMAMQGVLNTAPRDVPKAKMAGVNVQSKRPEPTGVRIPAQASAQSVSIPAPEFTASKTKLPIVVSSSLMANRSLIRKLQQRVPALDVSERDSSIFTEDKPRLGSTTTTSSSSAQEADLTLSPSTGLIFTTLQKLKQKPLPGQESSFVGIRDQVAQVLPRYERLIVLFSEGSQSPQTQHIRTLDERDSVAIADFTGFFAMIDSEVRVNYIPGGEDELVKWISALVISCAPRIEGFDLLDEETVQERFLRRAGMNCFAAQIVLDQLKPHSAPRSGPEGYESYGLAAFVAMGVEERVRRFGKLLGGERMLRRVSLAVDGTWKKCC